MEQIPSLEDKIANIEVGLAGIIFKHYASLDSTMDEARRLVRIDDTRNTLMGRRSLVCISAEQQEKGRGQHGKAWASPKSAGLYFSLLTNLKIALEKNSSNLSKNSAQESPPSVKAAELCIEVLESFLEKYSIAARKTLSLKPLNDIYYQGAKLAGILIEKFSLEEEEYTVVGIGINLFKSTYLLKESLLSSPRAEPISIEEIYGIEAANLLKENFLAEISLAFLNSFFTD